MSLDVGREVAMKGGAISRTHTSVAARPEQKMSRVRVAPRKRFVILSKNLVLVTYAPSTVERQVNQKSANARRRRRDREEAERRE